VIHLSQILTQYPENLRVHSESILKEYLQYKILNSIFNSKYSGKLAFLGGTALRIIYGSTRFSEDLDFDNFDLNEKEFRDLSSIVGADLSMEGLMVEVSMVTKNAYRINIRIPGLLFDFGLSPANKHKILLQIDTVPQNFSYVPDKPFLNKFEVFAQINAVPKNLLLSQKIFASVDRKRPMGRDFFDIVFLYGIGAKPDFKYLKKNIGVGDQKELGKYLLEKTRHFDFEALSKDVEPLLFDPKDKKKVSLFREFLSREIP